MPSTPRTARREKPNTNIPIHTVSTLNPISSTFSSNAMNQSSQQLQSPSNILYQQNQQKKEDEFKIVILGDKGVGKTSFTIHFIVHEYLDQMEGKRRRMTLTSPRMTVVDRETELKKMKIEELEHAVQAFNTAPKQGFRYLASSSLIPDSPEGKARFLLQNKDISPIKIGEFLSDPSSKDVLEAFMRLFDLRELTFVEAIRKVFQGVFVLPKEAQAIDRIIETFAKEYMEQQKKVLLLNPFKIIQPKWFHIWTFKYQQQLMQQQSQNDKKSNSKLKRLATNNTNFSANSSGNNSPANTMSPRPTPLQFGDEFLVNSPSSLNSFNDPLSHVYFSHYDSLYILTYAILLLNTDLHNDKVKNKIPKKQFKENMFINPDFVKGVLLPFDTNDNLQSYLQREEKRFWELKRSNRASMSVSAATSGNGSPIPIEDGAKNNETSSVAHSPSSTTATVGGQDENGEQPSLMEKRVAEMLEKKTRPRRLSSDNADLTIVKQNRIAEKLQDETVNENELSPEQRNFLVDAFGGINSSPSSPSSRRSSIAAVSGPSVATGQNISTFTNSLSQASRESLRKSLVKKRISMATNGASTSTSAPPSPTKFAQSNNLAEHYIEVNNTVESAQDVIAKKKLFAEMFLDYVYDEIQKNKLELSADQEKSMSGEGREYMDMRGTGIIKDCYTRKVIYNNRSIKVNIIDNIIPKGQESFQSLEHEYLRQADGVIFMYSITDWESFQNVKNVHYKKVMRTIDREIPMFLVGNKLDIEQEHRKVTYDQGEYLARKYMGGIPFFESSTDSIPVHRLTNLSIDTVEGTKSPKIDPNVSQDLLLSDEDDYGVREVVEIFMRIIKRAYNANHPEHAQMIQQQQKAQLYAKASTVPVAELEGQISSATVPQSEKDSKSNNKKKCIIN